MIRRRGSSPSLRVTTSVRSFSAMCTMRRSWGVIGSSSISSPNSTASFAARSARSSRAARAPRPVAVGVERHPAAGPALGAARDLREQVLQRVDGLPALADEPGGAVALHARQQVALVLALLHDHGRVEPHAAHHGVERAREGIGARAGSGGVVAGLDHFLFFFFLERVALAGRAGREGPFGGGRRRVVPVADASTGARSSGASCGSGASSASGAS